MEVTNTISTKIDKNGRHVQIILEDTAKLNRYASPSVYCELVAPTTLFPTNTLDTPDNPMQPKTHSKP